MIQKFPKIFRNFYFVTSVVFLTWMLLFDNNDLINQYHHSAAYHELLKQKDYYNENIEKVKSDMKSLRTDKDKLERFAREKYLMHREKEDVFVIVRE